MRAFEFGQEVRIKLAAGPVPTMSLAQPGQMPQPKPIISGSGLQTGGPRGPAPSIGKAFADASGLTAAARTYHQNVPKPVQQLIGDSTANAARVNSGFLRGAAGLTGATVSAPVAATAYLPRKAWNYVVPQSWRHGALEPITTALQFPQTVFEQSKQLAANAGKDLYGGLGGDTNYHTQHAGAQLERGWNNPNVDPVTRNLARGANFVGQGAWIGAQAAAPIGEVFNAAGNVINGARVAQAPAAVAHAAHGGHGLAETAGHVVGHGTHAGEIMHHAHEGANLLDPAAFGHAVAGAH